MELADTIDLKSIYLYDSMGSNPIGGIMNYEKEIQFIYHHVNNFLDRVQRPEYKGKINVAFCFFKKSAVAHAKCVKRNGVIVEGHLEFDIHFWKRESEDERIATIAHELCHILQYILFPSDKRQKPHGVEFKNSMLLLGYEVKGADCYSEKHIAARKKL